MQRETISLYQDVFYFDKMSSHFLRAQVICIQDPMYAQLAVKAVVNPDVQMDVSDAAGFCSKRYEELFPTAQGAFLAKERMSRHIKACADEIKIVADLISFPKNHIILSPEHCAHTDEAAREAWEKRWEDFLKAHPEIAKTDEF